MELDGVKVDEDYKRYYPYGELASKVLGFTGGDNQGIIGLEVKYEEYLKGTNGTILTTDGRQGRGAGRMRRRSRMEPVPGNDLYRSAWITISRPTPSRLAEKVLEEKQAEQVSVLLMNPAERGDLCHGQCAGV